MAQKRKEIKPEKTAEEWNRELRQEFDAAYKIATDAGLPLPPKKQFKIHYGENARGRTIAHCNPWPTGDQRSQYEIVLPF